MGGAGVPPPVHRLHHLLAPLQRPPARQDRPRRSPLPAARVVKTETWASGQDWTTAAAERVEHVHSLIVFNTLADPFIYGIFRFWPCTDETGATTT